MLRPHTRGAPAEVWLACLDALVAELTTRGWTAYVTTPRGGPPAYSCRTPTTGPSARTS